MCTLLLLILYVLYVSRTCSRKIMQLYKKFLSVSFSKIQSHVFKGVDIKQFNLYICAICMPYCILLLQDGIRTACKVGNESVEFSNSHKLLSLIMEGYAHDMGFHFLPSGLWQTFLINRRKVRREGSEPIKFGE